VQKVCAEANSRRCCEKIKKISGFEAISGNFKRFQADFNAQLGVSSLH
jgi:hypothetical protein